MRGLLGGFFGEVQEPEVGRIEQDLAKLLLGRVEWLRARKTKRTSRW
mgnify:CR=1 FL=1